MAIQPIYPYEMYISSKDFDEIIKNLNKELLFSKKGLPNYEITQEIDCANTHLCARIKEVYSKAGWDTICYHNVYEGVRTLTLKLTHRNE